MKALMFLLLVAVAGTSHAKEFTLEFPNYVAVIHVRIVDRIPLVPDRSNPSAITMAAAMANEGSPFWSLLRERQATCDLWPVQLFPDYSFKDTFSWPGHLAFLVGTRPDTIETQSILAARSCGSAMVACTPVEIGGGFLGEFETLSYLHPRQGWRTVFYLATPKGLVDPGAVCGFAFRGGTR